MIGLSLRRLLAAIFVLFLCFAANAQPSGDQHFILEKRVWRTVDLDQPLEVPMAKPQHALVTLMNEAALSGVVPIYEINWNEYPKGNHYLDDFSPTTTYQAAPYVEPTMERMSIEALKGILHRRDTIFRMDEWGRPIEDYPKTRVNESYSIHEEIFSPDDVRYYSILEVWYWDLVTGEKGVRIEGIGPRQNIRDRQTMKHLGQRILYWMPYPELRAYLEKKEPISPNGETMTWKNILDLQLYSGAIYREGLFRIVEK